MPEERARRGECGKVVRVSRLTLLAAAAAIAALAPAAAQAAPAPFGHECTPQDGVRVCATATLDQRVPSFDGTPIDVDMYLPESGDGPFPTLILHHGLGGNKTAFAKPNSTNPGYDAPSLARSGYAVVMPTARGYANSCGTAASRTSDCDHGWTRLGDIRYEVRDLQTLLGILVDEGIAKPDALGTTGISYGGGFSTMLAYLKDRVKMPDGSLVPWRSPNGTPLSIKAAWPRWMWSNGASIFVRNGRASAWDNTPIGVPTRAYAGGIFLVGLSGFVAPPGGPLDTDLNLWKAKLDDARLGPDVQPVLKNAFDNHGVAGLPAPPGGPSALLLQSGWTDALVPVGQALTLYDAVRKQNPSAPIALQFGDLGHAPGTNRPADVAAFNAQGIQFLDSWLKGGTHTPPPGQASVQLMRCAEGATTTTYTAASYSRLAPKVVRFGTKRRLRIDSKGKSKDLATELSPLGGSASHCTVRSPDKTNKSQFAGRVKRAVTMVGRPVLTGRVATKGRLGQLDARLWDLNPRTGEQLLITRGAYRLEDNEKGRFRFTLDGNGWKFARGHRIVVELLGRDDPTYTPSPSAFSARLSKLRIALPVR